MKRKIYRSLGVFTALSIAVAAVWSVRRLSLAVERLAEAHESALQSGVPERTPEVSPAAAWAPSSPSAIAEPPIDEAGRGSGEVNLNGVDCATAAMLMAIVLHNTGLGPAELRFVSIKEVS